MASGGYGLGTGVPLRDRIGLTQPASPATSPSDDVGAQAQPSTAATPGSPARHCWVALPIDGATARPGLLLAWRRTGDHWQGQVVYSAELRLGQWATVCEWLPAHLLTQTTGDGRQT